MNAVNKFLFFLLVIGGLVYLWANISNSPGNNIIIHDPPKLLEPIE